MCTAAFMSSSSKAPLLHNSEEYQNKAATGHCCCNSVCGSAGVKLVLPAILRGVDDSAWRTKQGSIELLGTMAYLAPKQLSTSLPTVVPILGKTLSDPHPKVQASAKKALEEVLLTTLPLDKTNWVVRLMCSSVARVKIGMCVLCDSCLVSSSLLSHLASMWLG